MALTKKKGPVTAPKLPNIEALKKVNNNNAGAFYNDLLNAKHKIEYESRDISLFNIRTNPDNEIFREIDDDEDIRILADDIIVYSHFKCWPNNALHNANGILHYSFIVER